MGTLTTYRPELSRRIEDAYLDLSQEAFCAWLLLCTVGAPVTGRSKAASILKLSYRRSNSVIRELKNKGYLTLRPGANPSIPTQILVTTQAVISGNAWIVRLGIPRC